MKQEIETKMLDVVCWMSFVETLGHVLQDAYINSETLDRVDIEGLLYILNFYIKITKLKIRRLESAYFI